MLLRRGPRARSLWLTILLVISLAAIGVLQATNSRALAESHLPFPHPTSLQPRVHFWEQIFTRYSWRDFVLHDGNQVWKIYAVIHLPGNGAPSRRESRWAKHRLKTEYGGILKRLAAGARPTTAREREVARLFAGHSRRRFAIAAQNLRVQQGLRERFRKILVRSRRYQPMMERVFRRAGLPVQLTVLPSIESGFYPRARSSAGAVGIWQFTRSTGRHYLRIDRHHDERLNPLRATEAAAKLLRSNYQQLKSWPLAITAYNYGAGGMMRAAAAYDDNYVRILREFDGPAFGFAVKNYYSEFLAALQVYSHQHRYFPSVVQVAGSFDQEGAGSRVRSSRYRVHSGDTLWNISRRYGVPMDRIARANELRDPHNLHLGQVLLIPGHGGFVRRVARHYRVRSGDTLWRISRRYGVPMGRLVEVNDLDDPHDLSAGQLLLIPGHSGFSHRRARHYRVRRGDTLWSTAQRYGVSVRTLVRVNNLHNTRHLRVGRVLVIPAARPQELTSND